MVSLSPRIVQPDGGDNVPAGDSQYALDLAVAEVVQAGVPVMVAAGNEDTDACLKSPARYLPPFCLSPAASGFLPSACWLWDGLLICLSICLLISGWLCKLDMHKHHQ